MASGSGSSTAAPRSRRWRSPAGRRSRSPTLDGVPRGATWGPDDTIIFATDNAATGLQRVSAAGGTPTVLTRPDRAQGEADHLWPEMLPGGRAVLFTITAQTGGLDAAQVAVLDLRTGTHEGAGARRQSRALRRPSGHLVYVAAGTLRAIPFDLTRLETRGTPVPVLPRLVDNEHRRGRFRRGRRRHAGVRGRAGRPRGERAHARVGRSQGQRGARRRAAARLRASAPLARRDARRGLQQRSGERPLDLGPGTGDAHAPDARPGPGLVSRVDAGRPADHLQLGPRRRSGISAGRRPTAPARPSG